MKKIVITGGCGFLGHHVVEHFMRSGDAHIVVIDKLEHDRSLDRIRDISCFNNDRVTILSADLSAGPIEEGIAKEISGADVVLHLAAASHVDRSISHPAPFIQNNVMSTVHLLDWCRNQAPPPLFLYFSTDEVFGPAPVGVSHVEEDQHNPKNPYAASKSASEMIVASYDNTYEIPVIRTRTMNIFGERQHPEKFIPTIMRSVLAGETVPIHSDPTRTISGSRFWIHARNVASALQFILDGADGDPRRFVGETFHIVGEREVDNLSMGQHVSSIMGIPLRFEMVDFHSSRPGHDLRYAMSGAKLAAFGWTPPVHFDESLRRSVEWTLANRRWL